MFHHERTKNDIALFGSGSEVNSCACCCYKPVLNEVSNPGPAGRLHDLGWIQTNDTADKLEDILSVVACLGQSVSAQCEEADDSP